jgi:hypothetical protein
MVENVLSEDKRMNKIMLKLRRIEGVQDFVWGEEGRYPTTVKKKHTTEVFYCEREKLPAV